MQKTLTISIAYRHISLIKNKQKILEYGANRFKEADAYIKKQKYPKIQTYKDFITKQKQLQKIVLNVDENEQGTVKALASTDRPTIAFSRQIFYEPTRPDDDEIAQPYEHKTLLGFMKQGIKQRKFHHKYFFILLAFIPIQIFLYFKYFNPLREDMRETVAVADPKKFDNFSVTTCRKTVQQIQKRMKTFTKAALTANSQESIDV